MLAVFVYSFQNLGQSNPALTAIHVSNHSPVSFV
jgi:hypothetical protein